jgi:hypothetical protein
MPTHTKASRSVAHFTPSAHCVAQQTVGGHGGGAGKRTAHVEHVEGSGDEDCDVAECERDTSQDGYNPVYRWVGC